MTKEFETEIEKISFETEIEKISLDAWGSYFNSNNFIPIQNLYYAVFDEDEKKITTKRIVMDLRSTSYNDARKKLGENSLGFVSGNSVLRYKEAIGEYYKSQIKISLGS